MGRIALRRGLLLIAALVALTAVLAGLARVGVNVGWGPAQAFAHGPLFAVGVFGIVIALERAVALGEVWALAAPGAAAVFALSLLLGRLEAAALSGLSGALLVLVNTAILRRQSAAFTWLMWMASALLALGNFKWALGAAIPNVVVAWMMFFVLTITAERLELSRLVATPRWASRCLIALAGLGTVLTCVVLTGALSAVRGLGAVLCLLGIWTLRFDIARRTVRASGLPRFSATGILSGAAWLCVAGAVLLLRGLPPVGPDYDAALHAVFVGYVLSMVFAHAPIILPAVAGMKLPFSRALYTAMLLLHAGLALRVLGDLSGGELARRTGSILNAVALAAFVASVIYARVSAPAIIPQRRPT